MANVDRIRARGGRAHAMRVDITDAMSREALIRDVIATFGRIDILVNNAAIAVYESIEAMPLADAEAREAAHV